MPNWADPWGRILGTGGAGLGAAAGRALEPLDWARQALWNVPGKLAQGDFLGAAPGLLGGAAGLGLAATGAGLPLAALLGSVVGGGAQGLAKATDEERFRAPSGEDLVNSIGGEGSADTPGGMASSFLLSALGDPLSYAGGLGGRAAGRAAGTSMEKAAWQRGPRWPGGVEKLGIDPTIPRDAYASRLIDVDPRIRNMLDHPELPRMLGEIPPGMERIGGDTASAMAFGRPGEGVGGAGGVVRIGGGPGTIDLARLPEEAAQTDFNKGLPTAPPPRPDHPAILQPGRSVEIGGEGSQGYRFEHLSRADMVPHNDPAKWREFYQRYPTFDSTHQALVDQIEAEGLHAGKRTGGLDVGTGGDLHASNVGMTQHGRMASIDPDTIFVPQPQHGPAVRLPAGDVGVVPPGQPGRIKSFLLDMLGSDEAVRKDIQKALIAGSEGRGIPLVDPGQARLSVGGGPGPTPPTSAAGPAAQRRAAAQAGRPPRPSPGELAAEAENMRSPIQHDPWSINSPSAAPSPGMPHPSDAVFSLGMDIHDQMAAENMSSSGFDPHGAPWIRDPVVPGGSPEQDIRPSELLRQLTGGADVEGPRSSEVMRVLRRQLEKPSRPTDIRRVQATDLRRLGVLEHPPT